MVVLFISCLVRTHMSRRHASYMVSPWHWMYWLPGVSSRGNLQKQEGFPDYTISSSVFQLCVLYSVSVSLLDTTRVMGSHAQVFLFPISRTTYSWKKKLYTHDTYLLSRMMDMQKWTGILALGYLEMNSSWRRLIYTGHLIRTNDGSRERDGLMMRLIHL